MSDHQPESRVSSTIGPPSWFQPAVLVLLPLLGLLLGWGVLAIADWVAGLAWAPFQGPFQLVAEAPRPAATIIVLAVGAVAGLVFGLVVLGDSLVIEVSEEAVVLRRGDTVTRVERTELGSVHLDAKELVFLDETGLEVARVASDLPVDRVRNSLVEAGHPWRDSDPFVDDFRRWVEDTPDLTGAANAVLAARARALGTGEAKDAADLRRELIKLGLVLRDRDDRQYWRTVSDR
ncbi:MAG: YqeB family protein [Propionibacteriaceae bacterium]